jgi:hypothetical protein
VNHSPVYTSKPLVVILLQCTSDSSIQARMGDSPLKCPNLHILLPVHCTLYTPRTYVASRSIRVCFLLPRLASPTWSFVRPLGLWTTSISSKTSPGISPVSCSRQLALIDTWRGSRERCRILEVRDICTIKKERQNPLLGALSKFKKSFTRERSFISTRGGLVSDIKSRDP